MNEEQSMSEEEKKAIESAKEYVENEEVLSISTFDIKRLLNLIEKQQKEIEELKKPKYIMNIETSEITQISNDFISKDKVLKALGYEEGSQAYKSMDSEEKVISLIRLVNAECNRLEDIEDKKVMLEEHNIENMRDKYWQKKIRDKIKELDDLNSKFSQRVINSKERYFTEMIQNILKELLEEK
jgi:hypothetical protein